MLYNEIEKRLLCAAKTSLSISVTKDDTLFEKIQTNFSKLENKLFLEGVGIIYTNNVYKIFIP